MLNAALVEEVPAPLEDATYAWRTGDGGGVLMLRATASGLGQIANGEAATALVTTNGPAVGSAVDVAETIGSDG
jgi:hypothetical protein